MEKALLFIGDGHLEFLHDTEHILPDEAFGGHTLVTEEVAGVKSGDEGEAVERHPLAAYLGDAALGIMSHEAFHGGIAESDDDLGLDDFELSLEEREAVGHLIELGSPVTLFAYPNGQTADFNPELEDLLHRVGFKAAFTLIAGPSRMAEVRQNPLAIRRVYITRKDTLARFAAKLIGLPRLLGRDG